MQGQSIAIRFALAYVLGACGAQERAPAPPIVDGERPPSESPARTPDSMARIGGPEDWSTLAYRPEYQGTARTEVVKLVVELEEDFRVHFIHSSRFELHYTFVHQTIDSSLDHGRFNARQYRSPEREYICASLVHYLDGDHWSLEFVAGDQLDAARVLQTYEAVAERTFFGEHLRYRPLSPLHEDVVRELGDAMPTLSDADVMATARYQATVPGTGYGYLRIERGAFDAATVQPNQILVTASIPDDLPLAMGLITSRLQAPLAHVAVLSRNRGTPDMALRDATSDPRLLSLEGQLVRLVVGPQEFSIETADRAQAEADWARRRPSDAFSPPFDLDRRSLVELCDLRPPDVTFAGAKASQLGTVCSLAGVVTPGGFVVPFAHYHMHLEGSGAGRLLRSALTSESFAQNGTVRAEHLQAVRERIESHPVPRRLVREVRRRMQGQAGRRWIFRSSTNAEDLPGFNGAGLYRSVVVGPGASEEDIEHALREVWASVWLQRAHEERDWFRISPLSVKMAVLVQPFVEDVVGNGVAITANPFDAGRPGYYINVQTREGSVTGAGGDELPEALLVYTWTPTFEMHVLGRSSRSDGAILSQADAENLAAILERLHEALEPSYGDAANAVDVEFLLTRAERRFIIVQARPILVQRTDAQAGERRGRR